MAVVFTHLGELRALNAQKGYLATLDLRLFVNDHTPVRGDTAAAFVEATFPGYAAVNVGAWSGPYTNGDGKAEVGAVTKVWTYGAGLGSETVFGYWLTDPLDGEVVFAERGPGAGQLMSAPGNTYSVTPRVTGRSETG